MTRQDFLRELESALQGQLSQAAVNSNIRYYDSYMKEEMRKGKTEQAVLEALGNPRLIAKTLIDTTDEYHRAAGGGYHSKSCAQEDSARGFYNGYSQEDDFDVRREGRKRSSWLWKLFVIATAILIIVVVANVVAFLLPLLVPVVLILLICSLISGNRR
ncbi:DUF1700 domain-containing protein [Lachnospiraceae bacterium 45-W7]